MPGKTRRSTSGMTLFMCQMFCIFLDISHVNGSGFSVMTGVYVTLPLMKSSAKILRKLLMNSSAPLSLWLYHLLLIVVARE
jgi:hypothetical protein